jgi:hypothetical protein
MGVQNFDICTRDTLTDLRGILAETTPMSLFENYRFTVNGKMLTEFQEVGQAVQNDSRINLSLEPFDEKSSCHHLERVKDILASPL